MGRIEFKVIGALIMVIILMLVFNGCIAQKRPLQPLPGPGQAGEAKQPAVPGKDTSSGPIQEPDARHQRVKREVEKLAYVRSAPVIITGNAVIVGVNLRTGSRDKPNPDMKKEIEKRIRGCDRTIDTVAVTMEPQLVARIAKIEKDMTAGIPISGFVREVTEILRVISFNNVPVNLFVKPISS